MSEISLERSTFAHSALVWSVTLAALALLAAILAYWTWVWFAPLPAPRAQTIEAQPRVEAAYGLFGSAQRRPDTAAPTALAIRLLGVAAASGGKMGYAVLQLDANKTLAVREGTDIAPGLRLAQVQAQQIILERNGVRETLALPEKISRAREAAAAGAIAQPNTPVDTPRGTARVNQ